MWGQSLMSGANSVHQAVIELYVKACLSMVPQLRGLLSVCMAIKSGLGGGAGVVFAGEVHMGVYGVAHHQIAYFGLPGPRTRLRRYRYGRERYTMVMSACQRVHIS